MPIFEILCVKFTLEQAHTKPFVAATHICMTTTYWYVLSPSLLRPLCNWPQDSTFDAVAVFNYNSTRYLTLNFNQNTYEFLGSDFGTIKLQTPAEAAPWAIIFSNIYCVILS